MRLGCQDLRLHFGFDSILLLLALALSLSLCCFAQGDRSRRRGQILDPDPDSDSDSDPRVDKKIEDVEESGEGSCGGDESSLLPSLSSLGAW